jgi:hypothetical protein
LGQFQATQKYERETKELNTKIDLLEKQIRYREFEAFKKISSLEKENKRLSLENYGFQSGENDNRTHNRYYYLTKEKKRALNVSLFVLTLILACLMFKIYLTINDK